jgi:hypothetical protein
MMRAFIFALAAIVPALCGMGEARAADQLPAFDIARNCREEVAGGINSVAACSKDETDAKNELAKRWSEFSASNKKSCLGESAIGGEQSYVELLTCIEMSAGGHFSGGQQ